MPPKIQFTRDDVLAAAFRITRQQGLEAVNARAVAKALGCSTQPLFRAFHSMDEIRTEMLRMAGDVYAANLLRCGELSPKPYLGSGLAYLQLAREEPQLFRLLFMRDREMDGTQQQVDPTMDFVLSLVMQSTGLSREQARQFHLHLWVYVHGLATMIATHFVTLLPEEAERMLSQQYHAVRRLFNLLDWAEPEAGVPDATSPAGQLPPDHKPE